MLPNQQPEQTGSEIQLFTNPTFGSVRTAGTPDNPQFCLKDVCTALDLGQSAVRQRLSDDVVSTYPIPDSLNRIQLTNFVNEDGLYDVILDSRKPEAKAFRKWITSEVLPSIRKTGGYIRQEEGDSDADIMAKALMIAKKTIDDKKQRIQILEGEKAQLLEQNEALAPKAQYADDILQSTSTVTFTEAAKELNFTSATALLNRLVKARVLYRQSGRYLPYAKYCGKGYFASRTHRFYHSDGTPDASVMTVVTQKGRHFLHKFFGQSSQPVVDCTDVDLGGTAL